MSLSRKPKLLMIRYREALISASCDLVSRGSFESVIDKGGKTGKSIDRQSSSFNDLVWYPFGSQFLIEFFGTGPCVKRACVKLRRSIDAFDCIDTISEL